MSMACKLLGFDQSIIQRGSLRLQIPDGTKHSSQTDPNPNPFEARGHGVLLPVGINEHRACMTQVHPSWPKPACM
jgi:hypothetical protein